jgi:hypothetical protein
MRGGTAMLSPEVSRLDIDKLHIKIESMPTLRSLVQSRATQLLPKLLGEIREEIMHLQANINESKVSYLRQIGPIQQDIAIYRETLMAKAIEASRSVSLQAIERPGSRVRSDRCQKTSSQTGRTKKKVSGSHSERSVRAVERALTPVTPENPLDIWFRSAELFGRLPTKEDLDEICGAPVVDVGTRPSVKPHWSEEIMKKLHGGVKDTRKCKLQRPPGPPPSSDDLSSFWNGKRIAFPIEDLQKRNSSVIHRLLSAFVEAKQLAENVAAQQTRARDFLSTHVLLQRMSMDEYLSRPFDERLELELRSVGLESPVAADELEVLPFAREIEDLREQMEDLQPVIDHFRMELAEKLPIFRRMEEERIANHADFVDFLKEVKRKAHKK